MEKPASSAGGKPERGLAMALAGNGRWCYLDPKLGAMHAVAEAARKVACTGATPVAATNCLNFGNPMKPEIMAQLSQAIDGISEACTALGTPITGGNVSLYNETKGEGIYPTPVLGVVGILDDVTKAVPSGFQQEGDAVLIVFSSPADGKPEPVAPPSRMGTTEYARVIFGETWGTVKAIDLPAAARTQTFLSAAAEARLLRSASDIGSGGLPVALARNAMANNVGVRIHFPGEQPEPVSLADSFLEDGFLLVTCSQENVVSLQSLAQSHGLMTFQLGITGGDRLTATAKDGAFLDASLDELRSAFAGRLEEQLEAEVVLA